MCFADFDREAYLRAKRALRWRKGHYQTRADLDARLDEMAERVKAREQPC